MSPIAQSVDCGKKINNLLSKNQYKNLEKVISDIYNYISIKNVEKAKMLKEIGLLSDNMLCEWHWYKHEQKNLDYELWEEFKVFWKIDTLLYNENMYNEISEYINGLECEKFYAYRENANYHSYDSYSILKQLEICKDWVNCEDECDECECDDECEGNGTCECECECE